MFNRHRQRFSLQSLVQAVQQVNLETIQDVLQHTRRYRLATLAAGVTYGLWLAMLVGGVALLLAMRLNQPVAVALSWLAVSLGKLIPLAPLNQWPAWGQGVPPTSLSYWFPVLAFLALWLGSGAMRGIGRSLDLIHQIPVNQRRTGWRANLRAVLLFLGLGLLAGMALTLAYAGEGTITAAQGGEPFDLWLAKFNRCLHWLLALGIMVATFTILYRFAPSRWTPRSPLLPGAVLAAILWILAVAGLQRFAPALQADEALLGPVGRIVVLMLWVYGNVLTLLVGGQLNGSLARQRAIQLRRQMQQPVIPPSLEDLTIRRRPDQWP